MELNSLQLDLTKEIEGVWFPIDKETSLSSETKGDRFHKALREVDDCLSKNAEPYQFINLIETLC